MVGNDGLVVSVTMIEVRKRYISENGKLNMNNNPILNPAFET